jgi:hypothetical protein
MRRGIQRQDLAFIKAEYRACTEADERWRPIAEAMREALSILNRLTFETPDSSYLELVERDLRRAVDRFEAFRSTFDRRKELLRLAFSRAYPDAPAEPMRRYSPLRKDEYAEKFVAFYDAWEVENSSAAGVQTLKERIANQD